MRLGRYEMLEEIGRGGMARVHRGVDTATGDEVALKVIDLVAAQVEPELVVRFLAEVRAASQLSHPAIVRVHEAGRAEGLAYMAMDLLSGGSAEDRLRAGPLPPEQAVAVAVRLAEALAMAHEQGVLHRDLKPANVLFDQDGLAYLADFGLARVADATRLTQTGEVLGTPNYMAPEQALAERDRVGPRVDVYGLGATVFALLTGQPPFPGRNLLHVMQQVVNAPPPRPSELRPGLDPALDAAVLRCLAKDPADRPASMLEVIDLFRRQGAAPPSTQGAAPSSTASKWLLGALLGALLAVALVAGGLALRGSGSPESTPRPLARETTPSADPETQARLERVRSLIAAGEGAGGWRALAELSEPELQLAVTQWPESFEFRLALATALWGRAVVHASPRQIARGVSGGEGPLRVEIRDEQALAQAEHHLDFALTQRPDSGRAHFWGAQFQGARGRSRDAIAHFDRYFQLSESIRDDPDHALQIARAYLQRGCLRSELEPEGALTDLERAARVPAFRELADAQSAAVQIELWRLVDAGRTLDGLLEESGREPRYLLQRARVHLLRGEPSGASRLAEEALAREPESAEARRLSELCARRRQQQAALKAAYRSSDYERLLALCHEIGTPLEDPVSLHMQGLAILEQGYRAADQGSAREAIEHFDQALLRRPGEPSYLNERGRAYRWLGYPERAISDYLEALRRRTDSRTSVLYNLALALSGAGDEAEAAAVCGALLELDLPPHHATRVASIRIRSLRTSGQLEASRTFGEAWVGADEGAVQPRLELAHTLFDLGETQVALDRLLEFSRPELYLDQANARLVALFAAVDRPDLAREVAESGLRAEGILPAERARLALYLARVARAQGDLGQAERKLRAVLSDSPDDVGSRLLLAGVLLELGDRPGAKRVALDALNGNKLPLRYRLQPPHCQLDRGRALRRLEDLDRVDDLVGDHAVGIGLRAALLIELGQHERVQALLSNTIDLRPPERQDQLADLLRLRGWSSWLSGDAVAGERDLIEAFRLAPEDPPTHLLWARLSAEVDPQGAQEVLLDFLQRFGDVDTLRWIAEHQLRRIRGELSSWR